MVHKFPFTAFRSIILEKRESMELLFPTFFIIQHVIILLTMIKILIHCEDVRARNFYQYNFIQLYRTNAQI